MSEFQMLITWLASIGGFIVALLLLIEHRKARKEKRFWIRRDEENRNADTKITSALKDFRNEVKKDIQMIVGKNLLNYTTIEKNEKDNQAIKDELIEIRKEMQEHNTQFATYQRQNIATEIVRYAEALRRGETRTRNSFRHLATCYERYKALGGNHYIDEEWDYIKEAMKHEID